MAIRMMEGRRRKKPAQRSREWLMGFSWGMG
jgi:hypothetical protein